MPALRFIPLPLRRTKNVRLVARDSHALALASWRSHRSGYRDDSS